MHQISRSPSFPESAKNSGSSRHSTLRFSVTRDLISSIKIAIESFLFTDDGSIEKLIYSDFCFFFRVVQMFQGLLLILTHPEVQIFSHDQKSKLFHQGPNRNLSTGRRMFV